MAHLALKDRLSYNHIQCNQPQTEHRITCLPPLHAFAVKTTGERKEEGEKREREKRSVRGRKQHRIIQDHLSLTVVQEKVKGLDGGKKLF